MKTIVYLAMGIAAAGAPDPVTRMNDQAVTVAQRNDACFALRGNTSAETIAALRQALNDAKLRACAGENLRVAGAVDALRGALSDEDAEVRALAARELGTFQKPELLEALARMTRDPQLLVSSNALEALFEYPAPIAQPYLVDLANRGGLVGQMALERLAQSGDLEAAAIARRLVTKRDIGNMLAGMRVLGELGDTSDLPALEIIARKDTEEISPKGRGFGLMPAISLSRAARTAMAAIQARGPTEREK
ncbi:MAG TPA: HEAT repeat domain-containing protein [Bryobacteraceae bacterium]|nr:HEAT repeat domain-containing protein [Bryobacteraceae bacterium]